MDTWVCPSLHEPGVVAHSLRRQRQKDSEVILNQVEFETSLGYIRPCLKDKRNREQVGPDLRPVVSPSSHLSLLWQLTDSHRALPVSTFYTQCSVLRYVLIFYSVLFHCLRKSISLPGEALAFSVPSSFLNTAARPFPTHHVPLCRGCLCVLRNGVSRAGVGSLSRPSVRPSTHPRFGSTAMRMLPMAWLWLPVSEWRLAHVLALQSAVVPVIPSAPSRAQQPLLLAWTSFWLHKLSLFPGDDLAFQSHVSISYTLC